MRKRRINVAHFIGSLSIGGAQMYVVQLINHLEKTVFNKHIIVFSNKNKRLYERVGQDVRLYSMEFRRRTFPIGIINLVRYLKKNKIDVFHCHMYEPNKIGSLVGKMAQIPVIITGEHGKNPWKKFHHHFVEKHIISRVVTKRIAVSNDIREVRIKYDGVNPDQIITIPNSVVVPDYKCDNESTPRIVGSLGRLVEAKDYPSLFSTMQMLKDEGFNLHLRIAGEGHLEQALVQYIRDLGMEKSIELVGFQRPEVFLREIDIFAMSSIREGMPGALLEAMSHGLPVVATNVGGILEVIQDRKDGLLSDPQEPRAMAKNIRSLIEDKALRTRLGKRARKKIIQSYTIEKTAELYAQLYIELLSNSTR